MIHADNIWDSTTPIHPMENSITTVYDRHIETVYRICFSLMGNKQDAEDAAQTVFIKLMESKKSFIDAEHEKAWLIVTSQNHCRDLHRKWWRKKVIHLDSAMIPDADTDSIQTRSIKETLLDLPMKYRLILYLYYYEGYKLNEISSLLNLNLNTVKTRMRNAKRHLKIEIGDDTFE